MTKSFSFMGRGLGVETLRFVNAEDVHEAQEILKQWYVGTATSDQELFRYGTAYEVDNFPKHLSVDRFNFNEIVRLIKSGAVPFSYLYIDGKWYRADQNLVEQGAFDWPSEGERLRILQGKIIREHDAARFAFKPDRDGGSHMTTVTIPEPSPEVLEMAQQFLKNIVPDAMPDPLAVTRDIVRRFS